MNKEKVIEILKTVHDPELFIDIYRLGLIYNIDIIDNIVNIKMTLTSPMCPFGPQILDNVKSKLQAIEGVKDVNIELVFEPLWQPSEEIKAELGVE